MPSPKVIYASNESKSVLARNLEECRDNDKNLAKRVFNRLNAFLARNCEGTEQLTNYIKKKEGIKMASFNQDSRHQNAGKKQYSGDCGNRHVHRTDLYFYSSC